MFFVVDSFFFEAFCLFALLANGESFFFENEALLCKQNLFVAPVLFLLRSTCPTNIYDPSTKYIPKRITRIGVPASDSTYTKPVRW